MPTYNVTVARAYKVTVKARNRTMAKEIAEFFLGNPKDASEAQERKYFGFRFGEIEMVDNDAIVVEETSSL
jgi:hypothetical protein